MYLKAFASRPRHDRGGSIIEALLSVALLSFGMLGMLRLVSSSVAETGAVQYRSEASLLASELVSTMWIGDRSYSALVRRFGDPQSNEYQQWLSAVQSRLPGSQHRPPVIEISPDRQVRIELRWQAPGEPDPHAVQLSTVITD